jgi:hypothetical protein
MGWSAGVYTRTNGVNTGSGIWQSDAAALVKIRADRHDTHDYDLAQGINQCINKDGSNTATQLNVDNIRIDGNDISSQNVNGDITLTPNGTGSVNLGDKPLKRPEIIDYSETVVAHGNTGAAETIDLEGGNFHTCTLDDNCTFTFSNPSPTGKACGFTLILTQDGTGSRTATWPASVKWPNGSAPTLSTGAADVDMLAFVTVDAGTTWRGVVCGQDFA